MSLRTLLVAQCNQDISMARTLKTHTKPSPNGRGWPTLKDSQSFLNKTVDQVYVKFYKIIWVVKFIFIFHSNFSAKDFSYKDIKRKKKKNSNIIIMAEVTSYAYLINRTESQNVFTSDVRISKSQKKDFIIWVVHILLRKMKFEWSLSVTYIKAIKSYIFN